jgi:hypothetical protein
VTTDSARVPSGYITFTRTPLSVPRPPNNFRDLRNIQTQITYQRLQSVRSFIGHFRIAVRLAVRPFYTMADTLLHSSESGATGWVFPLPSVHCSSLCLAASWSAAFINYNPNCLQYVVSTSHSSLSRTSSLLLEDFPHRPRVTIVETAVR